MTENLFSTFFMGGFECADHINRSGERINLLRITEHDVRAGEDYRLLRENGIRTVREGICWSSVETSPFVFDFSEVQRRVDAASHFGIQQIWDLCHFGYPDGLIPTHPLFVPRFVALCKSFVLFMRKNTSDTIFIVPINEISFLSWHSGDMRGTVPFAVHSGFDIKYHLCKAAIAGIHAIRQMDDNCRILTVEPLIKIHPTPFIDDEEESKARDEDQFQAMDIIGGYICPELGGSPDNLDILGFNYYYNNQWYHRAGELPWPDMELKREPLSVLLEKAYYRYNRPIILTETGHFGALRAQWLLETARECFQAITNGVDLQGICIYPVTDRPDWDDLLYYCQCGLFDLDENCNRLPNAEYLGQLQECLLMYRVLLEKGPIENNEVFKSSLLSRS